jgi:hypothetical protein
MPNFATNPPLPGIGLHRNGKHYAVTRGSRDAHADLGAVSQRGKMPCGCGMEFQVIGIAIPQRRCCDLTSVSGLTLKTQKPLIASSRSFLCGTS